MDKTYISWEEIKNLSDELAEKIQEHCEDLETATLVAVSRGGLVPAQLIAYKLDIRDIRVMKLISYDKNNVRQETKDISTDRLFDGETVYIIDDLADSGETVRYLKERYPNSNICSLLVKDECKYKPDIYPEAGIKKHGEWLVFPWD